MIKEKLEKKEDFSAIECLIAGYLLDDADRIKSISAREIAKQLHIAPSSLTRFCQKMGYPGYLAFKEAYLQEVAYLNQHFSWIDPNFPVNDNDKCMIVANKMKQYYTESIQDVHALLHHDQLQKAVRLLSDAKTIYIVSAGLQADIAMAFKNKMLRINKKVIIETKMNEAFYHASYVTKDELFIMISYSGETEMLLRVARRLKEKQAKTLAMTTYGGNTLTSLANEVLYVATREKLISNLGDFSINISTLYLLDVLYMNLFNEDYDNNLENRVQTAKNFEIYRHSNNPILED